MPRAWSLLHGTPPFLKTTPAETCRAPFDMPRQRLEQKRERAARDGFTLYGDRHVSQSFRMP